MSLRTCENISENVLVPFWVRWPHKSFVSLEFDFVPWKICDHLINNWPIYGLLHILHFTMSPIFFLTTWCLDWPNHRSTPALNMLTDSLTYLKFTIIIIIMILWCSKILSCIAIIMSSNATINFFFSSSVKFIFTNLLSWTCCH